MIQLLVILAFITAIFTGCTSSTQVVTKIDLEVQSLENRIHFLEKNITVNTPTTSTTPSENGGDMGPGA